MIKIKRAFMANNKGRIVIAFCVLCVAIAAFFAFLITPRQGAKATAQALSDVGRFRVGAPLGEERAGFSGLPKLQVFANPDEPGWASLQACLTDPVIEAELVAFTPVLVDERSDLETEQILREREGIRVVARGLNGKVLGVLQAGFSCVDLLDLLREIQANMIQAPEKSPIYARLLETPEPIDDLVSRGEEARANRVVDFLKEFEGANSPAAVAAESRLPR